MPVNMDPKRKRKAESQGSSPTEASQQPGGQQPHDPNAVTEADLAEKEWKNLWEATEVIDMDTW